MVVRVICVFAAVMYVMSARAETDGIYLNGSYLSSDTDFGNDSDRDSGYALSLGYSLNDYLAAEASYYDFGTHTLPVVTDGGGEIDGDGTALQLVGKYPVEKFTFYGTLGMLWWGRDGVLGSVGGPVGFNADGSDWIYGLGCSYGIGERLDVRFEFKGARLGADDLRSGALGLSYRF